MLDTTKTAVAAILKADPTLNNGDRARLVALMEKPELDPVTGPASRLLRKSEVAERFNRSKRAVDYWVKAGILKPVRLPGQSRAIGFREADVAALAGGRVS